MMPTKREVIAELREWVRSARAFGYDDINIRCLEVALLCVKKTKWPRKRK